MTDPLDHDDEDDEQVVPVSPPLLLARAYLGNARKIGEPGSPTMIEAHDLQQQHADMARTAALVAIAESLERLATLSSANRRRIARAANAAETIAKEVTKLRYLIRRA